MAKKADDDLIPIKIQRKVEPAFKLPPIAPLPPSLRVSLPLEEIERQRRQVEEARRLEERLPKADPAKAARLAEGRRLLDRDMAIADGLIEPPWIKRLMKQLMERSPPVAAPPAPEPKNDTPVVSGSTEPRVEDKPRKDERRSRQRTRYAGAKAKHALTVLGRMFRDRDFPTRSESQMPTCGNRSPRNGAVLKEREGLLATIGLHRPQFCA
jgi:hypothetical protein